MDALSMLLEDVHLYHTQYYYIRGAEKWAFSLNKKDSIVIYLVESGGFCIRTGDTTRLVHTSDIIMLPAGSVHTIHAIDHADHDAIDIAPLLTIDRATAIELGSSFRQLDGEDDKQTSKLVMIICQYDPEITRPLLSALPKILPEHKGREMQKQMMLDIGTKILALESSQNRIGKTTIINRMASLIMVECLRTYIEDLPEATENWLKALKDPYLAKALAVMHERPDHNWTIHKLAEVAGMSRSSFAEHFRQVVGVPPLTYLTDYRLRLSARYLRLQENSISRISELVGYASDSTFSQAFKRVYGVSPKKYRQQFRQ